MRDEFAFKIAGENVLLSFAELDAAMQHQFGYEIVNIEDRLVQIFDKRQSGTNSYLGKMKVSDAVAKFH